MFQPPAVCACVQALTTVANHGPRAPTKSPRCTPGHTSTKLPVTHAHAHAQVFVTVDNEGPTQGPVTKFFGLADSPSPTVSAPMLLPPSVFPPLLASAFGSGWGPGGGKGRLSRVSDAALCLPRRSKHNADWCQFPGPPYHLWPEFFQFNSAITRCSQTRKKLGIGVANIMDMIVIMIISVISNRRGLFGHHAIRHAEVSSCQGPVEALLLPVAAFWKHCCCL